MNISNTDIEGLMVLEPEIFEDHRGFFMESYNKEVLEKLGVNLNFVQDNQSKSVFGVIRGLHFQAPPFAQTKLIRVLQGRVIDAVVDIRKSSPTFGSSFSIELSAANKKQLLIPKGFAHGFSVISNTAEILYKCDNYYNKDAEQGFRFDDPEFKIDWGLSSEQIIVSDKDKNLPSFINYKSYF